MSNLVKKKMKIEGKILNKEWMYYNHAYIVEQLQLAEKDQLKWEEKKRDNQDIQ